MRRKTGNLTGFLSSAAAEHERRAEARPSSKDFSSVEFPGVSGLLNVNHRAGCSIIPAKVRHRAMAIAAPTAC
jgi:hypothetical protein